MDYIFVRSAGEEKSRNKGMPMKRCAITKLVVGLATLILGVLIGIAARF